MVVVREIEKKRELQGLAAIYMGCIGIAVSSASAYDPVFVASNNMSISSVVVNNGLSVWNFIDSSSMV